MPVSFFVYDIEHIIKTNVLTERNRTGPPCSVSHPTAHAPSGRPTHPRQRYRQRQTTPTDYDDRQQTPASKTIGPTGLLGGPVIIIIDS